MKLHFAFLCGSLFAGSATAFSQQQFSHKYVFVSTRLQAFVDINEDTPRDVWTMEEYMANCGVQRAEGFQIYDSSEEIGASAPELDFAVYTSADLPAESPVLSIPAELILSSKTVRDTELKGIVEAAEASLQILGVKTDQFGMFHLFLKILMEYEKGDESPWFPWLNSLPRKYSNGASMTRTYLHVILCERCVMVCSLCGS